MRWIIWTAAALALAGCGSHGEQTRTLTERQRDSTIAASPLPGSAVVGRALAESDSAAARAARDNQTFGSGK